MPFRKTRCEECDRFLLQDGKCSYPHKDVAGPVNYRRIGLVVIWRSLMDLAVAAATRGRVNRTIHSAKEFCLTDNEDLNFWCAVAGISTRAIASRAQDVLDGKVTAKDLHKGYERLAKGSYETDSSDESRSGDSSESDSDDSGDATEAAIVDRLALELETVH